MPDTRVATKVLTTLVFIAGAFASSAVRSVDVTWIGPDGGDWNDGDNWIGNCPDGCFPPEDGDDVFLTTPSLAASTLVNYINPENLARFDSVLIQGGDDGEGNSIDITLNHQQDALSTGFLTVEGLAGGQGIYNLGGTGSLTVGGAQVGEFGTGVFTQDGGTHTVETDIFIGNGVGSTGTYALTGGSLTVGGLESVGGLGTATFSQDGGTNESGRLEVGVGGDGTYIQSDGINTVRFDLTIGGVIARDGQDFAGSGTYTQTGGTTAVGGTLLLGSAVGITGTYNLSGDATLTTANTTVGNPGTGTFNQTGGTHTILSTDGASGTLTLGQNAGSTGTYNLSGASTLTADREIIGNAGTGIFTHFSGTHSVTDSLSLGAASGGNGTYTLGGTGELISTNTTVGGAGVGTFNQSGGRNTISNALTVGATSGSSGSYSQSGGATSAASVVLGRDVGSVGTYTLTGGALSVAETLTVGGAGAGTLNVAGGSLSAAQLINNGSLNFSGGDISANLINTATVNVSGAGTRTFGGEVTNQGTFKVTDTTAVYTGTFNNHGAYVSDPSTNDFQDLNVGPQGYLAGGASDTFIVRGNFVNSSSQNANWKTEESNLVFAARNNPTSSDTTHQIGLPGEDRGPNKNGFQNNFAWGQVTLNSGERLTLSDANNVPGAALYASRFALGDGISQLKGISGDYNIYYDPNLTENRYLAGNAFNFGAGAGQLVPQGFTFFGAPGTTLLDAASLGFTANELSFADALNSACPSATGALADRCRELRALDDAQRQQAVANLTPTQQLSQVVAPIKLNFARMDAPLLRMAQLRSGHAQPVTFSFNGYQMPFTQLAAVLGPNPRGGAAGDPESLDEPFRDKPFGVYVQGKFDHGSQSINPDSFGFNVDSRALTIGTDYRFTDALVGGVALEYNNVHTSFHNSGGSMETEALLGAIYGSYYLPEDFYVDGMATYGSNDYALTRTYNYPGFAGRSTSNPNAYQYSFSLSGGKEIAWQEWLFTPYTRFEYIQMQFDRYQEKAGDGLAVDVASQSVSSAITTLGTQISYHFSMPWGILIPAIRFEWEHQFLNNNQANAMVLSAAAAGTGNFNIQSGVPDRDYVNLGGSLSATLPEGGAVFLRYDTRLGQSYIANHIVEAGIKIPF